MMARLLDEGVPSNSHSNPTSLHGGGAGAMGEASKSQPHHAPGRKLSFKTRQTASRSNYRTAKVSLSSSNVALLASKFNTIVIEDGAQGRALLRKLSSNQRKPSITKENKRSVSVRGEGVVKAAIEIFEHQDETSNASKQTFKKGSDLRPKLVVMRKSSSKHSVKSEDQPKETELKKTDTANKDVKDSVDFRSVEINKIIITSNSEGKEVRRKPSLKAKPVLRSNTKNKQESVSTLNQRIAKFNSNENISINKANESVSKRDIGKPKFNMNERIAQFSKSEPNKSIAPLDDRKSTNKLIKNFKENKKIMAFDSEEKENKTDGTKSILRNSYNKQVSLVEQTKNRLATIVQKDNTNHKNISHPLVKNVTGGSLASGKFISREKELRIFDSTPDIIMSVEGKDEGSNRRLSVPKDATILENVFIDSNKKNVNNDISVEMSSGRFTERRHSTSGKKEPKQSESLESTKVDNFIEETMTNLQIEKNTCKLSPCKNSKYGSIKSSTKPVASESPKLEKKSLCVAPDPDEGIQLDKIKPNNSFLWKPSSKMSVATEVPIYDDRPESRCSDKVFDDDVSIFHTNDLDDKRSGVEESEFNNANSLNLNVASSFILEMTEQIDRRFSSSSVHEQYMEDTDFRSSLGEINGYLLKNSSFLHGKNKLSNSNEVTMPYKSVKNSQTTTNKSNTQKPMMTLVLQNESPTGIIDIPPQLPEKKSKTIKETCDNSAPPPIPPSYTKPKVVRTPSEEAWIDNCKKILEIPPPLRKQAGEVSCFELSFEAQSKKIPILDHHMNVKEKIFSVSQVELLRKMSEMNLSNKRNSLPSDNIGVSSPFLDPEEDHYSSIQNMEETEVDDQDAYEAIGENNYAEIEDGNVVESNKAREGDTTSNIYDDVGVVEGEAEDHYEAINCTLVAAQDSDSSCDQSNSLYGLTRPGSQGGGYQAGLAGGSDTSDEWIDLDNSDEQHESVFIFREKERRGAETWSMKVRRQWTRKADGNDGSDESLPRSYENIEVNDETSYCDDFDDSFSDSSFDQETINSHVQVEEKRPAPLSEGIYGFMKQAGQRMRKHWPLGKSLSRMRKSKGSSSAQTTASLGRRGWSFKSKEKPSTTQSTFYLHSNTLTRTDSKTETKVDPRRLSTVSMLARPTSPPPPPPPPRNSVDETSRRKLLLNSSNSSSGDNEGYIEGQRRLSRNGNSNSMWYIESSTDTASEHGSSQGSDLNLRFADEPLYQFYAENIAKLTLSALSERDSEGYEEISPAEFSSPVPSALDLVANCHHRSLWCEVPQVRNSGVLDTLNQSRKRLQEAKFEVMTSEASYFKSLTVLDKLFASCPLFCDENILSREDKITLFGNVCSVRKCSEKLLTVLQSCWQDCILMQGMSDVVHDHIRTERQVYIKYCTNQIYMDRTLKKLKQTNSNFITVLSQLESDPQCQSLTLYSFLMLPMQRITRLRLLYETILSLLEPSDSEFLPAQKTLDALNKCVTECNEGARSQERYEEMVKLSKQLDFPSEMAVPILEPGSGRWLVRSGPVTQVNLDAKQTFSRRLSRSGPKLTLFLFTDLLLITKKKSEESYQVVDHCQRSLVETREIRDCPGHNRCLLQLTLLENAEKKTIDMTVSCESEPEHQRWVQVLSPPQSDQPGETLYEGWDCPQVTVVYAHTPQQPDELPLALGDIVNVLRKSEGWFYGERTRDGEKGWFPGNYSREIASKHVRARNLKQRHRLLQLSADLVQQQRKFKS